MFFFLGRSIVDVLSLSPFLFPFFLTHTRPPAGPAAFAQARAKDRVGGQVRGVASRRRRRRDEGSCCDENVFWVSIERSKK